MTEKKFDKPLNEWTEEEIEVPSFKVNTNDKGEIVGVEQTTTIRKVKTIYTESKPEKLECGKGKHSWYMSDRHKHIASCKNCPKNRFLRAVYETIKDGNIVDRDTMEIVD